MIDDDEGEFVDEKQILGNDNYITETKAKIQKSLSITTEDKLAPLATKWTFWLDSHKNKLLTKEDYEAGLEIIYSVDTVQGFWSVFNNISQPSQLSSRVSYHLMRENRKPLWEDRENENGGIYSYKCPKHKTNTVWQDLCLTAIGEQFSTIDNDDIVGISVQSRDTSTDLIQIWNSNPSDEAQKLIDEKIHTLFPDIIFPVKFYKPNSAHMNFEMKTK